jgi:hypothetical protein
MCYNAWTVITYLLVLIEHCMTSSFSVWSPVMEEALACFGHLFQIHELILDDAEESPLQKWWYYSRVTTGSLVKVLAHATHSSW